jgi:hypothetical protein
MAREVGVLSASKVFCPERSKMTLDTLKHLRKITPVMIGITYLFLVGYLTSTWSFELPKSSDLETGSVAFLFLAWFAYVFSFRDKINKTHHNKILSNIRLQIVDIDGKTDDPRVYTWSILKPFGRRRARPHQPKRTLSVDFLLTKSEICAINVPIGGIGACRGEESPRLFEDLPDHNRGVRAGEEEISLFFSPATP